MQSPLRNQQKKISLVFVTCHASAPAMAKVIWHGSIYIKTRHHLLLHIPQLIKLLHVKTLTIVTNTFDQKILKSTGELHKHLRSDEADLVDLDSFCSSDLVESIYPLLSSSIKYNWKKTQETNPETTNNNETKTELVKDLNKQNLKSPNASFRFTTSSSTNSSLDPHRAMKSSDLAVNQQSQTSLWLEDSRSGNKGTFQTI